MFKKQHLALAIAATLAAGSAQAALETSVTLKNETAYMMKDGIRTGEATSTTDTTGDGKGVYKFENTAKIFLNDELDNGMSWHGELNIVRDTKAIDDYKGHESYSQQDWLRELYVDTTAGDWDVRVGKQQVVWGTADGIKLLDMINPTDWREMNQNAPADARIPVWMINAERYLDNGANVQLIVSQAEESKIAGIHDADGGERLTGTNNPGAAGAPFVMKGVDTITGKVNGFVNIAPDMGDFAATFQGAMTAPGDPFGAQAAFGAAAALAAAADPGFNPAAGGGLGAYDLTVGEMFTGGLEPLMGQLGAAYDTNLLGQWGMFSYMTNATANTILGFSGITAEYRKSLPDDLDANFATRYKNTTANGVNYSFNYAYRYDSNPVVSVHWEDNAGNKVDPTITESQLNAGRYTVTGGNKIVFEETLERIHTLGGAMDMAIETDSLGPVVLRGEWTYDKDVKTPTIDRSRLSYGDFVGAMNNKENDFFKYVIGADVTVATDMMISGQFIQFRNLDYINSRTNSVTGAACAAGDANCGEYTADASAMHLTNGLKAAEENKEFYSLFFSKPFGDSGEGRWNNIFIYEEGGGKWNRFDVEYGFDDQLIGTFEVNKYFGDENTMFGQFENASNVQIGVKYLLQ